MNIKMMRPEYRYPLFFAGAMVMSLAGFAQRYLRIGEGATVAAVALGFIALVLSIVLP